VKKFLLALVVIAATGCSSVPSDVVESIGVLRENTHKLAENYSALLERSGPAEGQEAADWNKHTEHQKVLMGANNTLADKVYEWAKVSEEDSGGEASASEGE
jgi:hypothetical protein